jgi:hypothetical protein
VRLIEVESVGMARFYAQSPGVGSQKTAPAAKRAPPPAARAADRIATIAACLKNTRPA